MSKEIKLAYQNNQPAGDFWTQGGSALMAPPAAAAPGGFGNGGTGPTGIKPSPIRKAHRLLRGRYPLAIVLAAAGALAGGVAGYMAVPTKFESDALLAMNPVVVRPGDDNRIVDMVNMKMAAQTGLIQSTGVAEETLRDPNFISAWKRAYRTPLPSPADLLLAVDAERVKASPLIKIAYVDQDKKVAEAGARAVTAAFMTLHGNGDDFSDNRRKIDFDSNVLGEIKAEIATRKKELDELAERYHTRDLTVQLNAVEEELARLTAALNQAKLNYDGAVAAAKGVPVTPTNTDKEYIYEQIAAISPDMRKLLDNRETAKNQVENDLANDFGKNSPVFKRDQQAYDRAQKRVEDFKNEFLVRSNGRIPYVTANGDSSANLAVLKERVDELQSGVDRQSDDAKAIGKQKQQIDDVKAELVQLEQKRIRTENAVELLAAEQVLTVSVKVEDPGSEGSPDSKKRKLAAAGGFAFGGLLPLGMLLLYGLTENRFRYSEDASSTDMAGVTLLGILPNLPDRLSDPQQAGIAAHCVHQIRTMLQISRSNDEPQVLAVSSASSGDGKTSLTLALGLSYAACGARTLLVDCDLVAAGLTHRLNVNSPDGVLEAVANRALLEYVRTTDIADVAILPVGTTHAHHASTLSPVALRRLLSEAKKTFDIIIVDTGPILGSIEASLVCAAADRTILAVAANQKKGLVEKSIGHLRDIGAVLAGVVFNKAQARDFERSVHGLSLRSRPPGGGPPKSPGHDSAARAVEGSFKRAG